MVFDKVSIYMYVFIREFLNYDFKGMSKASVSKFLSRSNQIS